MLLDIVPNHTSDQHPWFQRGARGRRPARPSARASCSATAAAPTATSRPTTGAASSAAAPGRASPRPTAARASGTCTCSPPSSPTSTGPTPRSAPTSRRCCGSGSTAASTGSASTSPTAWSRPTGCPTSARRSGRRRPRDRASTTRTGTATASTTSTAGGARVADAYDAPRVFVAEAWVHDAERLARYLRPDELHTAFNFDFLLAPWRGRRRCATRSTTTLDAHGAVGAPPTWVLSNHDVVREVSRYARPQDARPLRGLDDLVGLPADFELGRAARARGGAADARAARRRLRLPGRGARAAGGRGPARRGAAGPDLGAVGAHRPRPRRLPRADPVVGRRAAVRLQPRRRGGSPWLPQPADWAALDGRGADRRPALDARALPRARWRSGASGAGARRRRRCEWLDAPDGRSRSGAATRSRAWSTSPPNRWRRRRGRRRCSSARR